MRAAGPAPAASRPALANDASSPLPSPTDRVLWLAAATVLGALLILLGVEHYWLRDLKFDDAYIHFRYAENIAQGEGFVYNPGERILGSRGSGVPITQSQVGERGEHMRFDETVGRRTRRRRHALHVAEESNRRGRLSLCQADGCSREVDGVDPFMFGGELVERCACFIWHPEPGQPLGDHGCADVHTGEKRLHTHRGGQRLEG